MYLDKPMRDHVLLQAIARVNRPYVDAQGVQKRVGLVVDFVGVLRELKKALQFDSRRRERRDRGPRSAAEGLPRQDREGEKRLSRCRRRAAAPTSGWRSVVYGRFLDPEPRKAFFEAYKEIEALWEILSPSPELRDHIATYKRLAQLYAAVRNAYAEHGRLRRRSRLQDAASG